jgi:uncharacterized C2H2 Zn-finger protein
MPENATQRFLIGVAADAQDFLRRQCPRCGLDFKQKGEPDQKHDSLAWWLQETVREEAASAKAEVPLPSGTLTHCPYCGASDQSQAFVHPELVSYIRQIARREIIEPAIEKMLASFSSRLRSSKYLKVKVTAPSGRRPRPISGPEPDDQLRVRCLACGDVFKINEAWRGAVTCPSCSATLLPQ